MKMNIGERAKALEKRSLSEKIKIDKETLIKLVGSLGLYSVIMLVMEIFI